MHFKLTRKLWRRYREEIIASEPFLEKVRDKEFISYSFSVLHPIGQFVPYNFNFLEFLNCITHYLRPPEALIDFYHLPPGHPF